MRKKLAVIGFGTVLFLTFFAQGGAQEDTIARVAVETVKAQFRLPQDTEVRYIEKKESPIPDFFAVKLLLSMPDREQPIVAFIDKAGEKVILGTLYVKGEDFNAKAAGPSIPKKVDMGSLEIEKSPSLGAKEAKVTIVEFANFECSHCQDSWSMLKEFIGKHPGEVRYVFKNFPFRTQGKAYELAEIAAAAQEVSNDAFWVVHDFLFTDAGQRLVGMERQQMLIKIEELLKTAGHDMPAFRSALATGKGKKRVGEDMAVGNGIRVSGTPTKVVNGDIIVGATGDGVLEMYFWK